VVAEKTAKKLQGATFFCRTFYMYEFHISFTVNQYHPISHLAVTHQSTYNELTTI